jgi:hypothetical protein
MEEREAGLIGGEKTHPLLRKGWATLKRSKAKREGNSSFLAVCACVMGVEGIQK